MGLVKQEKQSTKSCPICGNTNLLFWSTLNLKACSDCYIDIPWYKDEDQTGLYCYKHIRGKNENSTT